nr:HD-GYP domain-containing protein [Marinobacter caseinilyticus]
MGVRQKKVSVHDLEIGMFVSDLDRPWHTTPFPVQGFYIRSLDEIRSLMSHCKTVEIDVAEVAMAEEYDEVKAPVFARRANRRNSQNVLQLPPIAVRSPVRHDVASSLRKELKLSANLLGDARKALDYVASCIKAHTIPDTQRLTRVAKEMTASIIRNPDALLWLARVREHDDYTYQHALNTSVWALVCGRHLGLQEGLLTHLAVGCLLAHVGKVVLPKEILENEHCLDVEQYSLFKTYAERGAVQLEEAGMSRAVVSIVRGHRERHNGSGFPAALKGDKIPLLAKIAGLVDHYETLIEPRQGHTPMTPAQAVSQLFEQRNIEFQEDLVEKFIQSIGIYPTGTLVELNSGERGVVVSHSPTRRLWPRVMVMTNRNHEPLRTAKVINLASVNEDRTAQEMLQIEGCLPFGTDGLNPNHFDVTGTESRWNLKKLVGG